MAPLLLKSNKLTSIGSTSWAMMTSWAFLLSTREVTVFTPVRSSDTFHYIRLKHAALTCFVLGQCSELKSSIPSQNVSGEEIQGIIAFNIQTLIKQLHTKPHLHGGQGASWLVCHPCRRPSAQHGPAASASSPAWSLACICGPT